MTALLRAIIGWFVFQWRFRRVRVVRTETPCRDIGPTPHQGTTTGTVLTILDVGWREALVEVRLGYEQEVGWGRRPWRVPLSFLWPVKLPPEPPRPRRFDQLLGSRLTGGGDA